MLPFNRINPVIELSKYLTLSQNMHEFYNFFLPPDPDPLSYIDHESHVVAQVFLHISSTQLGLNVYVIKNDGLPPYRRYVVASCAYSCKFRGPPVYVEGKITNFPLFTAFPCTTASFIFHFSYFFLLFHTIDGRWSNIPQFILK